MADDYIAMVNRIANEIDDDGLTDEIKLAILDAIKRYQSHPFWFNSVIAKSFAVATDDEYLAPALTVTNLSAVEPINTIDLLTIDDGSGANYREVVPVDNSEMDAAQSGSITGRPRNYALVADSDGTQLRFYPIADQAYTAKLSGVIRFAAPSDDGDTSPWFVDAEMLIRQAAKGILAADVTRDSGAMAVATAAEARALADLRKETLRRTPASPLRTDVAGMQRGSRGRYDITTDR